MGLLYDYATKTADRGIVRFRYLKFPKFFTNPELQLYKNAGDMNITPGAILISTSGNFKERQLWDLPSLILGECNILPFSLHLSSSSHLLYWYAEDGSCWGRGKRGKL